jgi:hypothetical protein
MITGPAERDNQRHYGADSATYGDNQGWRMMVCGGSRQDHDNSLAQAHTTLG